MLQQCEIKYEIKIKVDLSITWQKFLQKKKDSTNRGVFTKWDLILVQNKKKRKGRCGHFFRSTAGPKPTSTISMTA